MLRLHHRRHRHPAQARTFVIRLSLAVVQSSRALAYCDALARIAVRKFLNESTQWFYALCVASLSTGAPPPPAGMPLLGLGDPLATDNEMRPQTYMTHRHTLRSFRFFLTSQVHHHHRRACYHHHHHQVGRSYTYILFPYRCMVYIRYNWRKYTEVAAILVLKHTCVCRDLSSGPPPPPPWKEVRKLFWWKQLSHVGAWQFVLILPWT